MRLAHHSIVATLLILGTAWGFCLVLAGLHAMRLGLEPENADLVLTALGIAGVAAGNFVFMEVVADRLLARRAGRARDLTEMTAAGVMIASLALSAAVWLARTLP